MKKPDYIILIHKYAMDHLEQGATTTEVFDFLRGEGINVDDPQLNNSIIQVFGQVYVDSYRANVGYTSGDLARYWMQSEAYYRHLDYIEMNEAHRSSKTATTIAIWAIVISGLLAIGQIVVALINQQ